MKYYKNVKTNELGVCVNFELHNEEWKEITETQYQKEIKILEDKEKEN